MLISQSVSALPENFVYLRDVDPTIEQDIRYATAENFTGLARAIPGYRAGECIIRQPVACALKRVQKKLVAQGKSLKLYDCYRPQKAVDQFVAWAADRGGPDLRLQYYPRLRKEQLIPLDYINPRSGHSKGTTVDITAINLGEMRPPIGNQASYAACTDQDPLRRIPDNSLDMGTGFDCFDELSHTAHPEVEKYSPQAWRNRLDLIRSMESEGFKNYVKERWHFSYPKTSSGTIYYNFDILPRPISRAIRCN